MQPTDWRPLAVPLSPTTVVVGGAGSVGGEGLGGVGGDEAKHKEAGGDGYGTHTGGGNGAYGAREEPGETCPAASPSTADAAVPEATAVAVPEMLAAPSNVMMHPARAKMQE